MRSSNDQSILKTMLTAALNKTGKRGIYQWILPTLLGLRQEYLLQMIEFVLNESMVVVDMGCNVGYLTYPLSLRANAIGLDVDKEKLYSAKESMRNTDFVCCDLRNLPLRESSIDLAVCASVFEHIENLEQALKDIKSVIKKKGILAAGYPIETRLLEFIVKSFWVSESRIWDQGNKRKTDRLRDPHTHKQEFSDIRKMLGKDFVQLRMRKIPVNWLPDSLSIYENVLLLNDRK